MQYASFNTGSHNRSMTLICSDCSHENPSDAGFCQDCGQPLMRDCASCGTSNTLEAKFCLQCGTRLDVKSDPEQESKLKSLQETAPHELREKIKAARTEIEGQRKPVTIVFTDIVGSTAIAEKLDPEEWKEVVQGAHHHVSEAVHRYEGTIAQLLGDGVLAFFGAPITHEDDPERAVRAALDLQDGIREYREALAGFVDDFHIRVGIHTGEVVVGPVGGEGHTEYLAIGDAVNIAARLEGAAAPDQVLISKSCASFVEHAVELEAFKPIKAKGKSEPVQAAVVQGLKAEPGLARGIGGVRTPFVGREVELAQLEGILLDLCQGKGQIVALIGDTGIGKTRLLEEARKTTCEEGSNERNLHFDPKSIRWLEGRALSYGGSLSFWMINQLLLADLGLSDGASQVKIKAALRKRLWDLFEEEKATRILPFLTHLLGLSQEGIDAKLIEHMDGESIKLQTMIYLAEYFERIAEMCPTILVLEDLHWADPSSLETLTHLLPLTDRVPLTFALLMRIDPDHGSWELKSTVQKELPHRLTEIHLHRLGSRESQMLVEQLLRPDVIPEDLRKLILLRADGNPFYLEEVVRHLLESELVIEQNGQWIVSESITEVGLPETLQGVLLARIDRLEEDVRDTLQMASVIGKSFLFKLLQAIAEAESELELHLTQLQRADLVWEKVRLPDLEYIFKHSLTQEAAYNSLLIERRRTFHLKVGESMEELFSDRIEDFLGLLAYHFESAGSLEKAGDFLVRAGDKAFKEAASKETIDYFTRARKIYEKLDDQVKIGQLENWLGNIHWIVGDRHTATEYLSRSLSTLESSGDTIEHAWVIYDISRMHMLASEYDKAIDWGEQALSLSEKLGAEEVQAEVLNNLGCSRISIGRIEKGLNDLQESLRLSLELGFSDSASRGYYNLGEQLIAIGRYKEARANYELYHDHALRAGVYKGIDEALAILRLAQLDWLQGRWGAALDRIPKFEEELIGVMNVWAHSMIGMMNNDLGQAEKVCNDLENLLAVAVSADELQTTVPYLGQLARAYADLGRDEETARTIQQLIDLIDGNPYFDHASTTSLLFSCQWFAAQSDVSSLEKCKGSVYRLESLYKQLEFPEPKAALEEGRGYLALAQDQPEQATEHFRKAVEVWESLGRPYDEARALGYLGRAQVALDQPETAKESLNEALNLIGNLADQLEDDEVRNSFLESQLVSEIRQARAALATS